MVMAGWNRRTGPALLVAMLALAAGRRAGADNVHFLDRNRGEARRVLADLSAKAAKEPTAERLADLGWMRLLYESDPGTAREHFQASLDLKDDQASALQGLLVVHLWRAMQREAGRAVLDAVCRAPGDPGSVVLARGEDALPYWYHPPKLVVERLSRALPNAPFETARAFRRELAANFRRMGEFEKAFRHWVRNGNVTEWFCLGTLGEESEAAFDDELGPERGVDLEARYTVGLEETGWERVALTAYDGDPKEAVARKLKDRGNVFFLLTFFKAGKAGPAAVRTAIGASHEIYLNGALAGAADRFARILPKRLAFGVRLREGWNALLVKVASRRASCLGTSPVSLTRLDCAPLSGLVFSTDFGPADRPRPSPAEDEEPVVLVPSVLERLRAVVSDPETKTVPACLYLAGLLEEEGLQEEARSVFEDLLEAHGACPLVRWSVARFEASDRFHLTSEECRARAEEGYQEALASDPGFLPARISLGEFYLRKDKEKALTMFRRAAETNPASFQALEGLLETYRSLGWDAEAYRQLEALGRLHPDDPRTSLARARWYGSKGNVPAQLAWTEAWMKARGSSHAAPLFPLWEALGRWEDLEAHYRDWAGKRPEDANIRGHLANVLIRLERYDQAREALAQVWKLDPDNRWAYGIEEKLEALAGNREGLERAWGRALDAPNKIGVYDHAARACLARRRGEDRGLPDALRVDARAVISDAPSPEDFEKVSSVVLFEQRVFRFFGAEPAACEEQRHRIVMILNKKGGEKYGRIHMPDRIVEARVFHADGRILEPDPVQEGRYIALPALDRGQIVETCTVRHHRLRPPTRDLRHLVHVTDLRRPDEKVLRFRLAVIFPSETEVEIVKRNLDEAPAVLESGKRTSYVWDLENLEAFEPEGFMPPPSRSLPAIFFLQGELDDPGLERELRGLCMRSTVPEAVREKAESLCEGCADDLAKLKAIYAWCVSEIKDGNEGPVQAIRKKEGSTKDLFWALAQGAGLEPEKVRYRRWPDLRTDWDFRTLSFEGDLVYLPVGDGGVYLYPARYTPFASLPPRTSGAEAVRITREGVHWVTLPTLSKLESSGIIRGTVTVSSGGDAEVDAALVIPGASAANLRSFFDRGLSASMKKMAVMQLANRLFQRIRIDDWALSDFDPEEPNTVLSFRGSISRFASRDGDRLVFRSIRTPLSMRRRLIRETERDFPALLDFGPGGGGAEEITYRFGEGVRVEAPPSRVGGGEFGLYAFSFRAEPGTLSVRREVRLYSQAVPPERWEALRRFCREIDELEQRTVKLVPGKG